MMWAYIAAFSAFSCVIVFAIVLASKNGSKAAQLEAIKEEIKRLEREEKKANEINKNVAYLSPDDARRRLHEVANKQSDRMQ